MHIALVIAGGRKVVRLQGRENGLVYDLVDFDVRPEHLVLLHGAGPIGRPQDLFDDPHLAASGGLEAVTLLDGIETRRPALPLEMGGGWPSCASRLSDAGDATRDVLRELGYSAERIDALIASVTAA